MSYQNGCGGCNQSTRFLCTNCNLCSSCCGCDDGGSGSYGCGDGSYTNNNQGGGGCSGGCNNPMPPMPGMQSMPSLPPAPPQYMCPSAVIHSYPPDPCCGTPRMPDISHPCPWPWYKRVFVPGCPIVPGYQGHVPGFRMHGAGRTYGDATRDTCCIMGQWGNCCPLLPCRIFEQ